MFTVKRHKLPMALAAVAALLPILSGRAGAAPLPGLAPERVLAGPCAPGASYDASCDVDHDGDVDIFDIQLTAGRWGQSGTWVSDNNHDHLGQNWTGSDSLAIIGSFGSPHYAALVLDNNHPSGDGLVVAQAGGAGVSVYYSGWSGIFVGASGVGGGNGDGVRVCSAGSVGSCPIDTASNGVEIGHATGNGLRVMSADGDGVSVQGVDGSGVSVQSAGAHGLFVGSAGGNGVYVGAAGAHGVYALTTNSAYNGVYGLNTGGGNGMRGDSNGAITSGVYGENSGGGFGVAGRVLNGGRAIYGEGGSGWAGWFNGSVTITGACSGCLLAFFAVNGGTRALQPGDVVSVRAVKQANIDNAPLLWDVAPAEPGQAAVGVVAGSAALLTAVDHLPAESGRQLASRPGRAGPGDYVQVVYSGPMQVRLAPGETAGAGARVTAGGDGRVRPLRSGTVDGMMVAEGAPTLGIALGDAADGLIWVLVNPQ